MAYKNRIIALVIALSLIVGAVPAFALASGSAMDEGIYSSAFGALRAFGIVDSDADDAVNTELITRYEFVKLIVRMYESAGVSFEGSANVFSDAQDGTKCAEVLAKAASAGIIHGDGSSDFRISDVITEDEGFLSALGVNDAAGSSTLCRFENSITRHDLDRLNCCFWTHCFGPTESIASFPGPGPGRLWYSPRPAWLTAPSVNSLITKLSPGSRNVGSSPDDSMTLVPTKWICA